MKYLYAITAATALMLGGASAGELPTFEVMGFPISPHQASLVGTADVQERAPAPMLTLAGMPVSPHQVAVLTRRPGLAGQQIAAGTLPR